MNGPRGRAGAEGQARVGDRQGSPAMRPAPIKYMGRAVEHVRGGKPTTPPREDGDRNVNEACDVVGVNMQVAGGDLGLPLVVAAWLDASDGCYSDQEMMFPDRLRLWSTASKTSALVRLLREAADGLERVAGHDRR